MYLEEAVSRVKIAQDIIPLSAARPGLCLNHFNAPKTEKVIRKYFPAIPDYVLEDSLQRGMCNIHGVNAALCYSCVIAQISPGGFYTAEPGGFNSGSRKRRGCFRQMLPHYI